MCDPDPLLLPAVPEQRVPESSEHKPWGTIRVNWFVKVMLEIINTCDGIVVDYKLA